MSVAPVVARPAQAPSRVSEESCATWGGLVAGAAADVRLAGAVLDTGRAPSRAGLADAQAAAAEVLAGVATSWSVLWRDGSPLAGPGGALGRRLAVLPSGPRRRDSRHAAAALLRAAAVSVRSSGDLLATHRDTAGEWRSPDGPLLAQPAVRLAGAGELARLVLAVADTAAVVARHAARVEAAGGRTRRMPAGLDAAAAAAAACSAGTPPLPAVLAGLGVARPAVDLGCPVRQLASRLRRVRHAAWSISGSCDAAAGTLADLALVAAEVAHLTATPGRPPARVSAQAWRELAALLAELRTVAPASAAVRADVSAIRRLLHAELQPRQARPVAVAAAAWLPQLAQWGRSAFERLAAGGRLYLCASALRGEEVTDHPDLVSAKLCGAAVLAPYDRVEAIRAAYARLAG